MSRRRVPKPALLVVSAIYRLEERFGEAAGRMAAVWGDPARISEPFPFDRTEYYAREMGGPLWRRFFVSGRFVPRDSLPALKIAAERIEQECSEGERRTVNLDPGLLTEENFVLATGKNYSHRIYLGEGVFADLTLLFRGGEYRALPWTYPDYASGEIRSFLGEIREGLRRREPAPERSRQRGDDVA
ncbi:MAG: DUF4416 family protein [Deltaproteobacteria bacterium]